MAYFLQANLNRSGRAYDLLVSDAAKKNMDVLLNSEPQVGSDFAGATYDSSRRAVVQILNKNLRETAPPESVHSFAKRVFDGVAIHSCYYLPNDPITIFARELDALEGSVTQCTGPAIVAGDFNSKSPAWSGGPQDRRGSLVSDLMASFGLVIVKKIGRRTFHRLGASSVLDLTIVSPQLVR